MRKLLCVLLVICLACPVMYRDAQAEAMSVLQQYPNQVALGLAIAAAGKTAIVAAWNAAMVVLPAAAGMAMLGIIVAMAIANDGITVEDAKAAAKKVSLSEYNDHNYCGYMEFRLVELIPHVGLKFLDNNCWNIAEAAGFALVGCDVWTASHEAALACAILIANYERCPVFMNTYSVDCDLNKADLVFHSELGKANHYQHFHVYAPFTNPDRAYQKKYVDANTTESHIFFGQALVSGAWPS